MLTFTIDTELIPNGWWIGTRPRSFVADTLARQERDAWVQWPARVAADLAASLGLETHTVQAELEAAVKAQLAELAELKPRFD
jgi:hypothetical protein